jgi:hypothetical protein
MVTLRNFETVGLSKNFKLRITSFFNNVVLAVRINTLVSDLTGSIIIDSAY